ncbi:Ig-like domain-containing protein [Planococcus shenhongbingii]|uniref:Ig-like domain-containing protein n=1 Tax=Planococcus shenhongbingii TaxID=3058398 RepID=UPI00262B0CF4|nr:Ig-like domain-containing protein [Planococcus sp. N016]WKA57804.1 Ig-like domain-containing protein [Planococcus sp. N016]
MIRKARNKGYALVFIFSLLFFVGLGAATVEASTPAAIEYIKIEKKKILTNQYQTIKIKLTDSTRVTHIQMSYKMPDGNYNAAQLYRNSLGEFEGRTFPSPAGEYTVANIMVLKQVGGALYMDQSEGGTYEFDEWNFTSYSADTTGPELDNLYVDNSSVLQNGNVTVTVEAYDDLSDIQSMYLDYKTPSGYYYQLPAINVGNNRFQVQIPSFMTSGLFNGEFECVGITIRDSYNNASSYYDYDYYSNRNLDAGNFTVKPEADSPILRNISIDKAEVNSQETLKVTAVVEDVSGVENVKVNFTSPFGYNMTIELNHTYGSIYEGEIPSYYTALDSGQWKVQFVWLNDVYSNSQYLWSNAVHWWGEDLSGGDFVVKEKDRTPPEKPELNEVYDFSTVISGWAEPYSTIDVFAEGGWLGSATVYAGGYFYFDMPAQEAGTYIAVTSTDSSGNGSEQATLIVRDGTPPGAPEVGSVSDSDTVINGQAEPGSSIEVVTEHTLIVVGFADENGSFLVEIPKQKAGTKLEFRALDAAGNMGDTKEVTVIDGTPPDLPIVDEVTDASTKVTGTAEADAVITIFQGTAEIAKGRSDSDGKYSIEIPKQAAGTKLEVTATDNSENMSGKKQVSVKDKTAPGVPAVNEVTDKSITVTGKAEARALVTVKKGTAVIGNANATVAGDFTVPIGKQQAGVTLSVVAMDAAENASKVKEVVVKDKTAPDAPTVKEVTDSSDSITGTAEIGSSITVQTETDWIGSATADSNGKFTIGISKLAGGSKLQITATDAAGNTSEIKEITLLDTMPPSIPEVKEVTDRSTTVEGQAEAEAVIHVKAGSVTIGKAATNVKGEYSVIIPKQKAGTVVSVTAVDLGGNVSPIAEVTVKDATAPTPPSVQEVTDQAESVSGIAEAGSVVTVMKGEALLGKSTATSEGKYSVAISKQKAGTVLKVQAADAAENMSEVKEITVIDMTAPASPTVKEITDQSTIVTGNAETGTKVTVKDGQTILVSGLAGEDRIYSIVINKQKPGITLSVISTDAAGNSSPETKVTVKDITAPNAPMVNAVTDQTISLIGTAELATTIVVKSGATILGENKVDAKGSYAVAIPKQVAGTNLIVVSVDASGNTSLPKEIRVTDGTAPNAPTVNDATEKTGKLSGTAEAGSLVQVRVGTAVIGKGSATANGTYEIIIPSQKAGTKLILTAIDQAGNKSLEKIITVKDVTAPSIPTIAPLDDNDIVITGKAETNAKVYAYIGTKKLGETVAKSGAYTIKIAKQKAGLNVSLHAIDAAGNKSGIKTVKVLDKTAPVIPTINTVADNSTALTGKAETSAVVYAYANNKKIGEVIAKNGVYTIKIAKQKAGTSISVYAVDPAKNKSGSKTIKVIDKTPPPAPTVNKVTSKSTAVSGKGEISALVFIYNGSTKVGQGTVDSRGNFNVKIKTQKKGATLKVNVQDKAGNKSGGISVKVN